VKKPIHQEKKNKQINNYSETNSNNNRQNNSINSPAVLQSHLEGPHMGLGGLALAEQFVPNITEQEQEIANNMILYMKLHIDGLLATIHHLRTENENLKKEKMERHQLGELLRYDCIILKNQLRFPLQTGETENQSSMMLGVVGNLSSDSFPPTPGSPNYTPVDSSHTTDTSANALMAAGVGALSVSALTSAVGVLSAGVGGMSAADATVNYLSLNSFMPSSDPHYNMMSINGGPPVPIGAEEHPQ